MKVHQAILAVQKDLAELGVKKMEKNQFSNYMYRGIDAVMNATAPLLAKHGLLIIPKHLTVSQADRLSKKGENQIHTMLEVEYTFVAAEDGSSVVTKICGEAIDSSDKSLNQADTAAYKNLLFKTFCIPVEGQADADSKTPEAGSKKPVASPEFLTEAQITEIDRLLIASNTSAEKVCTAYRVSSIAKLPQKDYDKIVARLESLAEAAALEQGA